MSCDVENCSSEIGRHSNLKLSVRKIRYKNENSEKTLADEKDLKIDSALFRMSRKNPKKSPVQRSCCGQAEHSSGGGVPAAGQSPTRHHSLPKKSSSSSQQPDRCDSSDSMNEQYSNCHHYHNNHFHSESASKCRTSAAVASAHSRSPFRENTTCSNHQHLSQIRSAAIRSTGRTTGYPQPCSDPHSDEHSSQAEPQSDEQSDDEEAHHLHDELDEESDEPDEPEEELEEDEGSFTDQEEESTDQSTTTSSTSTLHNLHNLRGASSANDEDNKSDKSGNCCNCCYCEVFGHGVPTKAPTSRNFDEIRDRLRTRLRSKQNNSDCHKSTGDPDELLHDHHSSSHLNHKRNSHLLNVSQQQQQLKSNEPSQKRDERDLDELLRFINNESESTKCEATKSKKKKDKKKKKGRPNGDGNEPYSEPNQEQNSTQNRELSHTGEPAIQQHQQGTHKNGNQKKANCDKQSRQSLRDEKNQRHAKQQQSLSCSSVKNGQRSSGSSGPTADRCNSRVPRVLFKGAADSADPQAKPFIPNNDQNSSLSKGNGKKQQPNKKSGKADKKVNKQPDSNSSNCNGQRNAASGVTEKDSCKKTSSKDALLGTTLFNVFSCSVAYASLTLLIIF